MPSNVNIFKADIAGFAEAIQVGVGLAVDKIARDLHGKITKRTPVDTGRARASWDVAVGAPSEYGGPAPATEPGESHAGKATYQAADFGNPNIDGTEIVYIVSNLVYMEPLENGHSQQSPFGMVALSIAEVIAEIDSILDGIENQT